MVTIRKTSNVVPFGKVSSSKEVGSTNQSSQAPSPFAVSQPDALKALRERKTTLSEEQRLAILQRALFPFSTEARSHLPSGLSEMEQRVRKRMLEEGFSEVIATEAGEEAVDVLLQQRRIQKSRKASHG